MTDTLEQTDERRRLTEWVTDSELIRRSGVPKKIMRQVLKAMDSNPRSGFPPKIKLWGDRRHWPSVQAYWLEQNRRKMDVPQIRRVS